MRKFGLIIPKAASTSRILQVHFFCLIIGVPAQVSGQQYYGCYVGKRIWVNEDFTNGHTGSPAYIHNPPNTLHYFSNRCSDESTKTCMIYDVDGVLLYEGNLGTVSFDNCPLDDYVWLLCIFTAVTAAFMMQKGRFYKAA